MKLLTFKFFIVSWLLLTMALSYAIEKLEIGDIIIHKYPIKYQELIFKNINNKYVDLEKLENKLIVLNFWATWCAPCREEMPSLSKLKNNKKFNNLAIFAINVGQEDLSRSQDFFKKLDINNLEIYFDPKINLANIFGLRGLPTPILINKNNEEFARILGAIDFQDENLINWLKKFD